MARKQKNSITLDEIFNWLFHLVIGISLIFIGGSLYHTGVVDNPLVVGMFMLFIGVLFISKAGMMEEYLHAKKTKR